ncbi:MAG: T9SS type A sorting domain-containing protein [Flavobacteriales bacterium]|nr:T9SS type A sorting domain-containing protein [Flavobacteriales bacterium]
MKRIATLIAFVIAFVTFQTNTADAQCPGCTIDATCGVGVSPVAPALCPAVLPNGMQGVYYDENATFFMPRDFVDAASGQSVTLNTITVTSVTGMPQGLSYQCDQPGCAYTVTTDPLTQRGCVKMCGTPTVPGNYNIVISVVANVGTPIGTINQPTGFTIPLTIDPAPGGNCCFSFNPPSACGSLDVTYEGLLNFEPLQPTTYDWDFGNGNTSTSATPPVQSYTTPGDFYPELVTTVYNYVVTDIDFTAAGSNWCGDVEEISFLGVCQGSPDIYYTFTNGNQSVQSSAGSNSLSQSWTNQGLVLENNLLSFQFWDSDGTSADDNLGVFSLNVTSTGTFQFSTFVNGNQEGFGTVTIGTEVETVYTTTDTVSVFPIPAQPQLVFSPAQEVCVGDSILISGPAGPYQYQWKQAGSFISDSIAVWVNETDYYALLIIDTNYYCGIESDSALVQLFTNPLPPVIAYNSNTGNMEVTNNPNGYDVEWYVDGVVVQGETGDTLANVGVGPYAAIYLNGGLCASGQSTEYSLCLPASIQPLNNDTLCCGDMVTFDASGFEVNPFSTIAWAVTPQSAGPVTDQQSATMAGDNGQILSEYGPVVDFSRNCVSYADSVASGSYYVTPFAIENPNVTPLTYDTLQGCSPYAEICPALSAADDNWEIFPMVFTFPDNSTLNVNDAIAFGLPITQQLLDLAGGLPCLALTDLFRGNPNGVWTISVTNTGTTALDMSVPDFVVINSVDSCNLITEDETYLIEGVDVTANPGQTVTISFNIPPLPSNFPSVSPECSAFGEPILITFKDCFPELTNNLVITGIVSNPTLDFQNNYIYGNIDVTITGGTLPYTISWADGPTSEDRLNLQPGTYTINVEDANGLTASETFVLTGPYLGIEDLNRYGFSLGQSVPNPTTGNSLISFQSNIQDNFTFIVRDASGREVARMAVPAKQGENRILFDGSNLSSGLYTYSLSNGTNALTERMIINK